MASVSFRNSEPNRISLKASQNETHRGQFGHFALTIYKHFALHKSKENSHNFNFTQKIKNTFSHFSLNLLGSKPQKLTKTSSIQDQISRTIEDKSTNQDLLLRLKCRGSLSLSQGSLAPLSPSHLLDLFVFIRSHSLHSI